MTGRQRLTFAAIAAAIAVVAIVVLVAAGGSDDSSKTTSVTSRSTPQPSQGADATATQGAQPQVRPQVTLVTIRGGQPVGGIKKISVNQGDRVRFRVKSDVADEIHVHGYDFHKDVTAGGTVSFDFPAKITGVFEAELENRGQQIISLTVNP